MKLIYHLLFISLLFSCVTTQAQDLHFSQFYNAPLLLNPALTGVMNSKLRITGNYRSQWGDVLKSNAFVTSSFAYDQKIAVGKSDYIGIGGNIWVDKAGQLSLQTNQLKLSVSYSKKMGGNRTRSHYLVAGLEAGIGQHRFNLLAGKWASQYNRAGEFDNRIPTGETFDMTTITYPDLSAGLLWFSVLDERTNFYLGAAFSHFNRPNQSFDSLQELPMYSKLTIHAGAELSNNRKFSLLPGIVVFSQGPSFQLNSGTNLKFHLSQDFYQRQSVQVGIWTRFASSTNTIWLDSENVNMLTSPRSLSIDAIILSSSFTYNNMSVGLSYDMNVSPLSSNTYSTSTFEVSVVYRFKGQEKRGVYCPEF